MQTSPYRNAMIAKIKIAQKQLGLDDGTYRTLLRSVTGKESCTLCTAGQLQAVLAEFRRKGWNPEFTPKRAGLSGPVVAKDLIPLRNKIAALLSDINRPWSYAEGILTRMYGKGTTVSTASRVQLAACVTALVKQSNRAAA